jgi:Flp pilus assembly protein CpaB
VTPEQISIFKAMSPADKLRLAMRFYHDARNLKKRGLQHLHPDWSEHQVEDKVRELFLYAAD